MCLLLFLSCLLPPLLIFRRLLPPFVSRSRADQVHVGAEVLAAGAGAVAGAVRAEAEFIGRELVEVSPFEEAAARKTRKPF